MATSTTKSTKARKRSQAASPKSRSTSKPVAAERKATAKCDKFGLRVGAKVSIAAAMFEKGCTMADVKAATGSTQYNVLQRLEQQGHRVTRVGRKISLTAKTS